MNPSKAPWYFLGLQEMLVYFDPWIAGVVMPSIIMVGLMVFPYTSTRIHSATAITRCDSALRALDVWRRLLAVDPLDRDRHVYSWPGLDLVLAGTDGITTPSCSIKRRPARHDRAELYRQDAASRIGRKPRKFIFGLIVVSGFYLVGAPSFTG